MTKSPLALSFLALSTLACATADARPINKPALVADSSPYTIELVSNAGQRLDTYHHRGRVYVNGQSGERYSIKVQNPTNRRIEAVISVDGLDVIDGKAANYKRKRGYIIQPHGQVIVDGFRVSTESVASFRFSSVSASYAGRKGKARNVGVIGVAVFTEKEQPIMAVPRHTHRHRKHSHNPRYDYDLSEESAQEAPAPSAAGSSDAPARVSKRKSMYRPSPNRAKERAGLGTAFGERRQSAVRFTQFVRANQKTPTLISSLRYNNAQGLQALGIRLRPYYNNRQEELATRESANPFPGMRFAQPPR